MGMCAVRGSLVRPSPDEEEIMDGEATPRSKASDASSYMSSSCSPSSSQELNDAGGAADQYDQAGHLALWQRPIPKGRRCRALSLSGVILFDPSKHMKLETS